MNIPQKFELPGLSCLSCVEKITARLRAHPDITEAVGTLHPSQATHWADVYHTIYNK